MVEDSKYDPVSISDKYTVINQLHTSDQGKAVLSKATVVSEEGQPTFVVLKQTPKNCLVHRGLENPATEIHIVQHLNSCMDNDDNKHDGICRMVEWQEDNDCWTLVLEHAQHGDLFEWVATRGALSEAEAKYVMLNLFDTVQWMHSVANVVHLDLSLENILLTTTTSKQKTMTGEVTLQDLKILICDFGMARTVTQMEGQYEKFPEPRSRVPGKLQYMAPELYEQQSFCGVQADVYSLGVCLFIMLFGFPPYAVPSSKRDPRFDKISTGRIEELCKSWKLKNIPSALALDIIGKMICKDQDRWTIEQLVRHPWFS